MILEGDLLGRLSAHYGLHHGYHDLSGHYHAAPASTQTRLLASLGVPTHSEAAAESHLQTCENSALLPRCLVIPVSQNDTYRIPLHDLGDASWSLQLEAGGDLPLTAEDDYLPIPMDLPLGDHWLSVRRKGQEIHRVPIIAVPASLETAAAQPKRFGLTVPLYGLRSRRNWGIGDFADLSSLAEQAAQKGADFIGINPVHALFPGDPARYGPYSPSSRNHLNIMHIAPDLMPELAHTPEGQAFLESPRISKQRRQLQHAEFVDYSGVYALKQAAFDLAFQIFDAYGADHPRVQAFKQFLTVAGQSLHDHALYEALADRLGSRDAPAYDWRQWPTGYETPESAKSRAFAADNTSTVRFYAYLQWVAHAQLAAAHKAACDAGMAIGLYLDIAVGMTPDGAEAWGGQDVIAPGVSLGAPGDAANPDGQMWNLAPLDPRKSLHSGFAHLRQTLRQSMQHAGMVRIDHILGINRSFWCPLEDNLPGGYITYPLDALLGVIALEAQRANCIVIGEDLGIVPDGFRETLHHRGLLTCALFLFERYPDGGFKQPGDYTAPALASLSNHDFPTLRGFLEGQDLAWRKTLGIGAEPERLEADHAARETDRFRIKAMLEHGSWTAPNPDASEIQEALHAFLGASRAHLVAVQIEDLLDQAEQMNVPGTTTEQPNWRRKLSHPIETLFTLEPVTRRLDAVKRGRAQTIV